MAAAVLERAAGRLENWFEQTGSRPIRDQNAYTGLLLLAADNLLYFHGRNAADSCQSGR